jgi:hypothetical protein
MVLDGAEYTADVGRGKALILDYVQSAIQAAGMSPDQVTFAWEQDLYRRWVLRLQKNQSTFVLRFTNRDVAAWPRYPSVIEGLYCAGVVKTLERLKAAQR